jgi:hypothetical protein
MSLSPVPHPFEPLMVVADQVAADRPDEIDVETAREVFHETATMLHNGLALDGLDDHDAEAVVAGLCVALVDRDPGAAVRALADRVLTEPGALHDPQTVSGSYLVVASILRI